MSDDYFDVFRLLGALIVICGYFTWLDWRKSRGCAGERLSGSLNIETHPIDTSPLTQRLDSVRRDYASHAHSPPPAKSPLVEERRAEIANMGYFQKPPPAPEPPEHEAGLPPLLVVQALSGSQWPKWLVGSFARPQALRFACRQELGMLFKGLVHASFFCYADDSEC